VKVKCICVGAAGLTLGKIYQVTHDSGNSYYLVNDAGHNVEYFKTRFQEVISDDVVESKETPASTVVKAKPATTTDPEEERLRALLRFRVDTRYECPKCGAPLPCNMHS
jgi:hypothetical protein